jgi:hypothetical protein
MAALATGMTVKWIDNLLSHYAVPGVVGGRQGRERSISLHGILAIELVRLATQELRMPIGPAVDLVTRLLAADPFAGSVRTSSGIVIDFPIAELERQLRERLVEAVEAAPSVPRGRPRLG